MINTLDTSNLALEPQALGSLRLAAKTDPKQSLRAVAKQFETVFLNILMKGMRSTTQGDGLFDSDQTRMYTELMDQQIAQKIAAGKGMGIADMLVAQLNRGVAADAPAAGLPIPLHPEAKPVPLRKENVPIPLKAALPGSDLMPLPQDRARTGTENAHSAKSFVSAVWPHAVNAAQDLGVAPTALLAQAALESGWGKREIKLADGSSSYNLFGIKAGPEWTGKTVDTATTEYTNGTPQAKVARFRAYDSYEAAFQDYAKLLKNSPRYAEALQASDGASFASALQRAGYATDPLYAAKMGRIMASATLREALDV